MNAKERKELDRKLAKGEQLSPAERANVFIIARREGWPVRKLAEALRMDGDGIEKFLAARQTQRAKDAIGKVGQELPRGVEN